MCLAEKFVAIVLWPWIAYAVAGIFSLPLLQIFFALVWFIQLVLYQLLTLHRNKNPILDHGAEDWLVIIAFPLGAIISLLLIVSGQSYFGFLLISPLVLFAGKSLYDAPRN